MWACRCDCGNVVTVHGTSLKSGTSTQCSQCRATHARPRKHGLTHHPLYRVWSRIKNCTTNPNHPDFKWYGAKGVKVCEQWHRDFAVFYDWAINSGYRQGLTIDRINVDGNYEPSNCRWVTIQEQSHNRTDNVKITHEGQTHTLARWSELTGIKVGTITSRYHKGWSSGDILNPRSYVRGGKLIVTK